MKLGQSIVIFAFLAVSVSSAMASEPYNQLITFQAGPFHPGSVNITNGQYAFNYDGGSLDSYFAEVGWGAKLFNFLGTVYFEEGFSFSTFQGSFQSSILPNSTNGQNLNAMMFGLDTRLMHAWDWFPWHSLIPFVEGGFQYTFYSQTGPSNLESAQGGVGNPVAGLGFRLWLNRGSSVSDDHVSRLSGIPIFITAKVNQIFPMAGNTNVDLSSTSYLAGLSIGL